MQVTDLPTPGLLLDHDRLEANVGRMAAHLAAHHVALRPHLKTAKCVEVARLVRSHGAAGLTVSTLREAEFFAAHGFNDLVYPATPVADKTARAAHLLRAGCRLLVCVEQPDGVRLLAAAGRAHGVTFEVLIEIDCGEHRAGVPPASRALLAIAAAIQAETAGVRLAGVLTHAGHSYQGRSPGECRRIADEERHAAVSSAELLRASGHPCGIVSAGSTPTAVHGRDFSGLTEVRAGIYTLGDSYQAGIGSHGLADIAMTVLTAVIGHQPTNHTLLVDAGGMALTKDRCTARLPPEHDSGYGWIAQADGTVLPGWRLVSAHQEHGAIAAPGPIDPAAYPLGTKLRVLPNHACMTAAQFDHYHVHRGPTVTGRWNRVRGW